MKAGWQSKIFEDCIEKVTYTTKIQRKDFLDTGAFPIVSQEESFINGYWDGAEDVFRAERPLVVFGDHTKVLKYIDFDFVLGADGVKLLLPKDFLVPKFFYYQLQTAQLDSLGYARHYKLLKELKIKYPNQAEQHRIVAILDEAFAGIATAKANAEKNLQNARALFESHLQSVFTERGEGCEITKLGESCVFSQGIQIDVKLQSESKLNDTQVRFLRIVDFTQGNEPPRYIDNPGAKFIVSASDVSLVRYGASTGFVCSGLEGAIANNLFRVIPNIPLTAAYLLWFLRSPIFQDEIKRRMNGAAMPAISFGMINDIEFPLPTLTEQAELVGVLNKLALQIQHLKSLYQQRLTALDDLKKSLLYRAFSGSL